MTDNGWIECQISQEGNCLTDAVRSWGTLRTTSACVICWCYIFGTWWLLSLQAFLKLPIFRCFISGLPFSTLDFLSARELGNFGSSVAVRLPSNKWRRVVNHWVTVVNHCWCDIDEAMKQATNALSWVNVSLVSTGWSYLVDCDGWEGSTMVQIITTWLDDTFPPHKLKNFTR